MTRRSPWNALFVFCEAARCGSFKEAAAVLCVTPGAVSRQILGLEDHVGYRLFERSALGVELTAKGEQLHRRIAPKMAAIAFEVEMLRRGARRSVVRVDAGVTLAMHWLIPRLGGFHEQHPEIAVEVSTSDGPIDLRRAGDVFIRREASELRSLQAQAFLGERAVLVAGPALLKGKPSPDWLSRQPRIGARSRQDLWPTWDDRPGGGDRTLAPTIEFDNTVLALQATCQGLGIMVAPLLFVQPMLDGRLLRLLSPRSVQSGTYAFATRNRRNPAAVQTFTNWLVAQLQS
jgi:LysR family glycine cleavage system transcriptional activator